MTEGYQYSQLSPSRSPSGPTYTQLSSGARTTTQQYHPVTTVPNNPSKSCSYGRPLIADDRATYTLHVCRPQVCGAGRVSSIRLLNLTDRRVPRWPRRHKHRIPAKPDLAHSHRNYPTCCRCCKTRAVRPDSRNSICLIQISSSKKIDEPMARSYFSTFPDVRVRSRKRFDPIDLFFLPGKLRRKSLLPIYTMDYYYYY